MRRSCFDFLCHVNSSTNQNILKENQIYLPNVDKRQLRLACLQMIRRLRPFQHVVQRINLLHQVLRQRPRLQRVQRLVQLLDLGHAKDDGVAAAPVQPAVEGRPAQRRRVAGDLVRLGQVQDGGGGDLDGWLAVEVAVDLADKVLTWVLWR